MSIEDYPKDNRKRLDAITKQHFIYTQNASIYNGAAGLYDFGPLGAILLSNITEIWKDNFIKPIPCVSEVRSSLISPKMVFKASGHLEKFDDLMFRDEITGEPLRADKYLKEHFSNEITKLKKKNKPEYQEAIKQFTIIIDNVENYTEKEIDTVVAKHSVKSPSGNSLTESFPFNLMFKFNLGAAGKSDAYLRPETAQGIFTNFNQLLKHHQALPFGVAQIGKGFRNEINPRSGLIRQREFEMAELEFFFIRKDLPENFKDVGSLKCWFESKLLFCDGIDFNSKISYLSRDGQNGTASLIEIYNTKIIKNPLVLYFMAKTVKYIVSIGLNKDFVRFRQHGSNEMAHYACDCWDLEVYCSYGWIEAAGLADRGCYDLSRHAEFSKLDFKVNGEYPSVVEPSYGISRLFYCVLEHSLWVRENDNKRNVLSLPAKVAPIKIAVIPLMPKDKLKAKAVELFKRIYQEEGKTKIDLASQNMGKKYARADEIGVKYVFTVDYQTLEEETVTIRERDSCAQIRIKTEDIENVVRRLNNQEEFQTVGEVIKK